MLVVSGQPWSGGPSRPQGGIQLRASPENVGSNSGIIYVALSGGVTMNSGTIGSGGLLDGMTLFAGDSYWVPRIGCSPVNSGGFFNLYASTFSATSGLVRLLYEMF